MAPHVFLFNITDNEFKGYYGDFCYKELFKVLLEISNNNLGAFGMYDGDLLLPAYCRKINKVNYDEKQLQTTYGINKYLYESLLFDLVESLSTSWHMFNKRELIFQINNKNLYCIVLTSLSKDTREHLDVLFDKISSFIGSAEIDLGNPLHLNLFINLLIKGSFIKDNKVYFEQNDFDENNNYPYWANSLDFDSIVPLDTYDFEKWFPKIEIPKELSNRGKLTSNIILNKGSFNHHQIVASSLINESLKKGFDKSFDFDINDFENNIVIPKEKLSGYSLNLEHPSGKHKAKLFRELLNIEANDWLYLSEQLKAGLYNGKVCLIRITDHGIQYHVDIPVQGKNRVKKIVRTAWIIKEDHTVRLTTAFIPTKDEQIEIINDDIEVLNEKDWEKIYSLADSKGFKAATSCIPTPVFWAGYTEPVLEGKCGDAYITVESENNEFIKWLNENGIGLFQEEKYFIPARNNTQSIERSESYAKEFVQVLRLHGINCDYVSYLD